jgi:hypothetical protein
MRAEETEPWAKVASHVMLDSILQFQVRRLVLDVLLENELHFQQCGHVDHAQKELQVEMKAVQRAKSARKGNSQKVKATTSARSAHPAGMPQRNKTIGARCAMLERHVLAVLISPRYVLQVGFLPKTSPKNVFPVPLVLQVRNQKVIHVRYVLRDVLLHLSTPQNVLCARLGCTSVRKGRPCAESVFAAGQLQC